MNSSYATLFAVKKTSIEMMIARGYQIEEEDEYILNCTLEEFIHLLNYPMIDLTYLQKLFSESQLSIEFTERSSLSRFYEKDDGTRFFMFFAPTPIGEKSDVVKKGVVEAFLRIICHKKCYEGAIISQNKLISQAAPLIKGATTNVACKVPVYFLQSFLDEELTFNVQNNILSPKDAKIISGRDVTNYLKENDLQLSKLQEIYISDPQAKFLGARVGDLFTCKTMNPESTRYEFNIRKVIEPVGFKPKTKEVGKSG